MLDQESQHKIEALESRLQELQSKIDSMTGGNGISVNFPVINATPRTLRISSSGVGTATDGSGAGSPGVGFNLVIVDVYENADLVEFEFLGRRL